jgi:hypothetical protein
LLLLAFPALADACACSGAAPGQCPGLQASDVVFLGTVTDAQLVPPQLPDQSNQSGQPVSPGATIAEDPAVRTSASSLTQGADQGTSQGDSAPPVPAAPVMRYHFRIDEKFAGPDDSEVDIFSGGDDGDCGYKFHKGDQYIVYTQQEAQGLFATVCNGTRPISQGAALLPQLRAMRDGKRVASVFGVLRRSDPPFLSPPDDPADPIPVISLKLRSKIDRFQANSGPDGVYTFYDVHAGTYDFTADLPPGTELTQKAQNAPLSAFEIPDGACYEYDVYALPTGHIRGSVFGPDGKPLPIASLELFRAGAYNAARPGYWGFQGATGEFAFDHVGPGKYILVYNRPNRMDPNSPFPRAFYPGVASVRQAKAITLKDGQTLQKVNFKVANGYASRSLRVHLAWTGPRPPGSVTVTAKADKYENPSVNKLADGLWSFTLFRDANYTISAWEDLAPQRTPTSRKGACVLPARISAASVTISGAAAATKEITLTFPKPACAKQ